MQAAPHLKTNRTDSCVHQRKTHSYVDALTVHLGNEKEVLTQHLFN